MLGAGGGVIVHNDFCAGLMGSGLPLYTSGLTPASPFSVCGADVCVHGRFEKPAFLDAAGVN